MGQEMTYTIDETELVRVCGDLIRFNTTNPPGNEQIAAEYVADYLAPLGFASRYLSHGENRRTLVARRKGSGGLPGLVFNGHLDVVPVGEQTWSHPPFAGEVADGKVWGRGSSDMKGGVAAMLVAAKALVQSGAPLRGDLIFTGTAGEEDTMIGAEAIRGADILGDIQAIVISEPTSNSVGTAERGVLWLELTTYGKTAHGSTPHLGQNAVMMLAPLLDDLQRMEIPFTPHPVLGGFTRSINTIHGGVATNVVPDRCVLTIDMRTVPGQDHAAIVRQIEAWLADQERRRPGFRASLAVSRDLPSATTMPDDPAVTRFVAAATRGMGREPQHAVVRFATEAAIFVPAFDVPAIIFGPGDPALAHQPDEFVEIARMVEAARAFAEIAAEFLA